MTRWNDAHRHDSGALAGLYAPTVRFYDTELPNADAVKRKHDALAAPPDYAQSLSAVERAPDDDNGGAFIRFKKTTTSKGQSNSLLGYLYVIGGHIVAEDVHSAGRW